MKTLFKKELRENLKLALPAGLLLATVAVFAARGGGNGLVDRGFLAKTGLFCACFGAALGWLQIHHERPRDLWAFLVHRPMTRAQIFFAKISAGLFLYALMTGLPLAGYLAWVRTPGNVAEPFEAAMVLPLAGIFLLGFVWYFAGMLTGLRQARWYASRGLGLMAALPVHLVAMALLGLLTFWQFHAAILVLAAILAIAVWGSFHADGYYAGQPAMGKLALAIVLAIGSTVCVIAALAALHALTIRDDSQTHYAVTRDGIVYRVTTRGSLPPTIADLAGVPLKDPRTGREMELPEFEKLVCESHHLSTDFEGPPRSNGDPGDPSQPFYRRWRKADGVVWYWTRRGWLVGYDALTRRYAGSLKPSGADVGIPVSAELFLRPQLPDDRRIAPRTLATATGLYQVDLRNRTNQSSFVISADDQIGGAKDVSEQATLVATRKFVGLFTAEGKPLWQVPYESRYLDSRQVEVFPLGATNQYALWIYPARLVSGTFAPKISRQMVWISGEPGAPKREELPPPDPPRPLADLLDQALAFLTPPEFPFIKPWLLKPTLQQVPIQWNLVRLGLAGGALSALAGWLISRRYNFAGPAQIGWAVFLLLTGFPGFLAFLSVQEWPAREPCLKCERLRTVDREKCEHCGADFSPPEKQGAEIFEPLVATFRA